MNVPFEVHAIVEKSRAAMEAGRPPAEVEAIVMHGIALAQDFVSKLTTPDETYANVLDDLATLHGSRAIARVQQEDRAGAIASLVALAACADTLVAAQFAPQASLIEGAAQIAEMIDQETEEGSDLSEQCMALLDRLEDFAPGSAMARAVEEIFEGLRDFIADLRAEGQTDSRIAQILADPLRGETHNIPLLVAFGQLVATMASKRSTYVATVPMALDLAAQPGGLDRELDNLEEMFLLDLRPGAAHKAASRTNQ